MIEANMTNTPAERAALGSVRNQERSEYLRMTAAQPPAAMTEDGTSHPLRLSASIQDGLGCEILDQKETRPAQAPTARRLDFCVRNGSASASAAQALDLGRPKMTAMLFRRNTKSQEDRSHRIG
jgi:hypothetical protein